MIHFLLRYTTEDAALQEEADQQNELKAKRLAAAAAAATTGNMKENGAALQLNNANFFPALGQLTSSSANLTPMATTVRPNVASAYSSAGTWGRSPSSTELSTIQGSVLVSVEAGDRTRAARDSVRREEELLMSGLVQTNQTMLTGGSVDAVGLKPISERQIALAEAFGKLQSQPLSSLPASASAAAGERADNPQIATADVFELLPYFSPALVAEQSLLPPDKRWGVLSRPLCPPFLLQYFTDHKAEVIKIEKK
jgi:hypothetical protein